MPPSAPPDLARLQRALREIFTDPRGARAAAAQRAEAVSWIETAPACDAATRLSVYGDGYFLRMLEALSSDYPALRRAAGEADFRALAAEYIAARPSTSPSLADLGEEFPEFVAGHRLSRRLPFLPDLARLEGCVARSLLTDRLPPLPPEAIARLPQESWAGAVLIIDPTVHLIETRWRVTGLWRRRAPAQRGRQTLLIHRGDGWPRVRPLSAAQWLALSRLKAGAPLEKALNGLTHAAPSDIRRWFSLWLEGGLIKGVQAPRSIAR